MNYIPMHEQIVDLLTKLLNKIHFDCFEKLLMLWKVVNTGIKEESSINIIRKYMDDLGRLMIIVEFIKTIIILVQGQKV